MSFIKYDYNQLRHFLSDMEAKHNRLVAAHGEVNEMAKSIQGTWTDEKSAAAYQATQTAWNNGFDDINGILNRLKMSADEAITNMETTNNQIAAGWNG